MADGKTQTASGGKIVRVGEMGGNNLLNSHCQDEGASAGQERYTLCLVSSWTNTRAHLDTPNTTYHPRPRITQDQLTHPCINPNTQPPPFILIGKVKTEQRTGQRSAFANKDACRGRPEGLRYFGGAFSDGYTCGGQVEGWRYAGRGHPGMCLPLGSAASPKKEEWNSDVSSPRFMRARKSKSDKSGQVGTWRAGCVRCGFYLNEGVQWLPH